jgi:hypothetical protein
MEEEFEDSSKLLSEQELEALLKEALTTKLKGQKKVPKKVELNKALISTLTEFLTCFKILGYDYNGDPVNLTVYKEKLEKSALDNQFMEEVSKFMSSKMG